MRILVLGAGGVGAAFAAIARRRDFFDHMVLADGVVTADHTIQRQLAAKKKAAKLP